MRQKFANNAESVLVKGVAKLENSLWIKTEHSESFPRLAPPISDVYNDSLPFFLATLSGKSPGGEENRWEIIRVIRCDGGELLARRGQEGTLARSWPAGTPISLRLTAETARQMLAVRPMIDGPALVRAGLTVEYAISNYCSFFSYFATFGDIGGALTEDASGKLLMRAPDGVPGPRALSVAVAEKGSQPDPEDWVRFPVEVIVPAVGRPGITNITQGETTNERELAGTAFVCNDPAERLSGVEMQLASNESFANIIFETTMPVSPDHAAEPPRVSMPDTVRRRSYTMYARLRYHSASGLVSAWSEVLKFVNGDSFFSGSVKRIKDKFDREWNGAMSPDGSFIAVVKREYTDVSRPVEAGVFCLKREFVGPWPRWREFNLHGRTNDQRLTPVSRYGCGSPFSMTNEKMYFGVVSSSESEYAQGLVRVGNVSDAENPNGELAVLPYPPGPEERSLFGSALAARAGYLVVGAAGSDKVFVYRDDQYLATIRKPAEAGTDASFFGSSVALSDNADVVVVGYGSRPAGVKRLAEIFVRAGTENSWTHAGSIDAREGFSVQTGPATMEEARSGALQKASPLAVSADGNTIVAGMTVPDDKHNMAVLGFYRTSGSLSWDFESKVAEGLLCGNALCLSADGRRLMFFAPFRGEFGKESWQVRGLNKGEMFYAYGFDITPDSVDAGFRRDSWCAISENGSRAAMGTKTARSYNDLSVCVVE